MLMMCKFARALPEEACNRYTSSPSQTDPPSLHTLDPSTAQYALPVEDYPAILEKPKPTFIHHPESKQHLQNIFREVGCNLMKTCFDGPKMRRFNHAYFNRGSVCSGTGYAGSWSSCR